MAVVAAYCTASDVYSVIPRGSLPSRGRLIESVDTDADTLELDGHGLSDDDEVTFRAQSGGSLPSPLVAATAYYVIEVNDYTIQVAATAGGAAIDLTTEGESIVLIPPDPLPAACEWGARMVDDQAPAGAVPFDSPYPEIIVMTNAELAAWRLTAGSGSATATLSDMLKETRARLARWYAGQPIRGANAPTATGLAASSATVSRVATAWSQHGGIR